MASSRDCFPIFFNVTPLLLSLGPRRPSPPSFSSGRRDHGEGGGRRARWATLPSVDCRVGGDGALRFVLFIMSEFRRCSTWTHTRRISTLKFWINLGEKMRTYWLELDSLLNPFHQGLPSRVHGQFPGLLVHLQLCSSPSAPQR